MDFQRTITNIRTDTPVCITNNEVFIGSKYDSLQTFFFGDVLKCNNSAP